jgi:hypothetical protein
MTMGLIQSLIEMSTRNPPEGTGRPGTEDLTTHLYRWADCLENVRPSASRNPMDLHGL